MRAWAVHVGRDENGQMPGPWPTAQPPVALFEAPAGFCSRGSSIILVPCAEPAFVQVSILLRLPCFLRFLLCLTFGGRERQGQDGP